MRDYLPKIFNGSIVRTKLSSFWAVPFGGALDPPIPTLPIEIATTASSSYTITVTGASATLNGQAATLKSARKLIITSQSVTLTGQSVAVRKGYLATVINASVGLSGQAATLNVDRKIAVTGQTVVLTWQSVSLRSSRSLSATDASIIVTPQSITLTYTPIATVYTLTVVPAAVLVTCGLVTITKSASPSDEIYTAHPGPGPTKKRKPPPPKRRRKSLEVAAKQPAYIEQERIAYRAPDGEQLLSKLLTTTTIVTQRQIQPTKHSIAVVEALRSLTQKPPSPIRAAEVIEDNDDEEDIEFLLMAGAI